MDPRSKVEKIVNIAKKAGLRQQWQCCQRCRQRGTVASWTLRFGAAHGTCGWRMAPWQERMALGGAWRSSVACLTVVLGMA